MTSMTEAGQTNQQSQQQVSLVDAINQVFVLFRLNYHNQYFKAYPDEQSLLLVKKLWFQSMEDLAPNSVLLAAKQIIREREFLPTLNQMLKVCHEVDNDGIPDAHAAYLEACNAPSPKRLHAWSHPIVYAAGQMSDWFFLSTNSEAVAFKVFEENYQRLRHSGGWRNRMPNTDEEHSITEDNHPKANDSTAKSYLKKLKETFES